MLASNPRFSSPEGAPFCLSKYLPAKINPQSQAANPWCYIFELRDNHELWVQKSDKDKKYRLKFFTKEIKKRRIDIGKFLLEIQFHPYILTIYKWNCQI